MTGGLLFKISVPEVRTPELGRRQLYGLFASVVVLVDSRQAGEDPKSIVYFRV